MFFENKLVALDCDDVIFGFYPTFVNLAEELLGKEIEELNKTYELSTRLNLTSDEIETVFAFMKEKELWGHLPFLDGAVDGIKKMIKQGAKIVLVSAMPSEQVTARAKSFEGKGLELDLIAVGVGNSKEDVYKNIHADIVIDDHMDHLLSAENANVPTRVLIKSQEVDSAEDGSTHQFDSLLEAVNSLSNNVKDDDVRSVA